MRYKSAYYASGSEQERISLTLQQLKARRGEVSVLFACICGWKEYPEAAEYCMTELLDWFRHSALAQCRNGSEQEMAVLCGSIEKKLLAVLEGILLPLRAGTPDITGVLCVGEGIVLFQNGSGRLYLLQHYFDRERPRKIAGGAGKLFLQQGRMQEGIGILLGTESFFAPLSERELGECMRMSELRAEDILQRRLQELGDEAARRGAKGTGAVLVCCEEDGKKGG